MPNARRSGRWCSALRGANAKTVVDGVKKKFEELKPRLPERTKIVVFYDRSDLIEKAVITVQEVLVEAVVLVMMLLVLFLGNLRAALVVSVILPLATLITFGVLRTVGYSANIMSLGGLAIAIGLLVDCAVVVVENVEHRLGACRQGRRQDAHADDAGRRARGRRAAGLGRRHHHHRVHAAAGAAGPGGPAVPPGRADDRIRARRRR